jgi:hypothetical protein
LTVTRSQEKTSSKTICDIYLENLNFQWPKTTTAFNYKTIKGQQLASVTKNNNGQQHQWPTSTQSNLEQENMENKKKDNFQHHQ